MIHICKSSHKTIFEGTHIAIYILQLFKLGNNLQQGYRISYKIPSESQRKAPDTNSRHLPVTPETPVAVAAPRWPGHSQTTAYAACS